jgi:hypothetical protein
MPKKLMLYLSALRMHSTFLTLNVATAPKSGLWCVEAILMLRLTPTPFAPLIETADMNIPVQNSKDLENKPRHATTTSRPVSMIFRNYNINPVIEVRRRW